MFFLLQADGDTLYGGDALNSEAALFLEYPTHNGVVFDWTETTNLWYHAVHDGLFLSLSRHPVFVTVPAETGEEDYEDKFRSVG